MNKQLQLIEEKLRSAGIQYQLIPLPEDLPEDVASHIMFHNISSQQAVPTIIYHTEKGLIAVQRRADTKFDLKKLKDFLGVHTLQFASSEDLQSIHTDSGIVPLVGLSIPYVMDEKVLEQGVIYGGSNDRLFALKLSAHDVSTINKAKVGSFTQDEEIHNKRVLSGIRATGRLHLGNYLGAVKGMLELQNNPEYETYYMVVDLHTLTTPYDRQHLKQSVRDIIIDYLAAGLNPEKSALFVQSMVPEHIELAYYFSTVTTVAKMQHLTTFKDKVKQHPENVTMALLNYPVLMAADILIYKAGLVPVGIDQEPHLEVAREIARRMNQDYGMDFPEPKRFATKGEYVPSLLGEGKMSKSVEGSYLNLTDDLDMIKKKLAKVPTDSGTTGGDVPKVGGVASLFSLLALFNHDDLHKKFKQDYEQGKIRYGEMKTLIAEAIYQELQPLQEKRKAIEAKPTYVDDVIAEGAHKAQTVAKKTIQEVKEKMGLL